MTFTLTAGVACDAGGICTAAGTTLTEVPAPRTVPGPGGDDGEGTSSTDLTASFSSMPSEHGGPGKRFTFELTFNEAPQVGYEKLRDHAFTVSGGEVRKAQRLERPSNIRWLITVEPFGWGDVSLTLPGGRACTATGAICTDDDRMLVNSPNATVQGSAALYVADANAVEGTGAMLDFAVILDRASTLTVTVDYATSNGTTTEDEDYTATSGRLTFAPGDIAKTVSVPVLDDAKDEGHQETMTLTLSNASNARIADGTGTAASTGEEPERRPPPSPGCRRNEPAQAGVNRRLQAETLRCDPVVVIFMYNKGGACAYHKPAQGRRFRHAGRAPSPSRPPETRRRGQSGYRRGERSPGR